MSASSASAPGGSGGSDESAETDEIAGGSPRTEPRRGRVLLGWIMVVAGVLLLFTVVWVGWRSYQAYSHLQTASTQVSTLQGQLDDITGTDPAVSAQTVERLQEETGSARSAVDDPLFRAATVTPFLGANLDALRQVTLTVDSLATEVMPSLVDVAETLQPSKLAPSNGTIDLSPIERISPLLQSADDAVNRARATIAGIARNDLVQPVGNAVGDLSRRLDSAADVTAPAARIARLLPPMLGADGPRTYLVVFQNPAELRATGGIFGSYAVVRADRGRITISEQGASSRTLGYFNPPVAQLSQNEIELYSELMAQYPMDVNFTPDFPTAAQLFTKMYRVRSGQSVDGVLALDPVALSYILKGAAPIDVGDGVSVTSDNLVSILLSTAYKKFDNNPDQSERDAFLAKATGTVFTDVMTGKGTPTSIISGLRKAVGERRILLYSNDPAEQADIATTGVAGAIDADPARPSIGVFLNDGTAAKLGYYLKNDIRVVAGSCRSDGRRDLTVRVTMRFDVPPSGLPPYVTGEFEPAKGYRLQTNVLVFAPASGRIVGATRDGAALAIGRGQDHSREVGTTTVVLTPGESTELVFSVLAPAVAGSETAVVPRLEVTPGVHPTTLSVDEYPSCGTTG